jgi:hypothetical protein
MGRTKEKLHPTNISRYAVPNDSYCETVGFKLKFNYEKAGALIVCESLVFFEMGYRYIGL